MDGKIGYIEQDHIYYSTAFGYKTAFTYFLEFEKGNLTEDRLNEIIGINI